MNSLIKLQSHDISFGSEQMATLRALGECRGREDLYTRQTPETLTTLRQAAVVESAECSNRLEGIIAPHGRIKSLVMHSTKPRNRSEQEISGYRDALDIMHESAQEMVLSPNLVLQLHGMLYRYLPQQGGSWKMADNEIVERDTKGQLVRVRFKPVAAVATPPAMADLCSTYMDILKSRRHDPLVVLPLAILDFLCIHPFTDGNGRVGRLLTLLLLYQHGYGVCRYISLERIIEASKETYYESLEASSAGWHDGQHDMMPWLNYFWGMLLRAYHEFEERVGTLAKGRGSKTEQVRRAAMRRVTPFAISDIEAECPGVSRDMVRIVLRQLRDEGIIVSSGRGRGSKWRKS